jgi:hypothetical protein
MNKLLKKIEIFAIVVVIAVVGIIYAFKESPVLSPSINKTAPIQQDSALNASLTVATNELNQPAPETSIIYQGEDGRNALELLRANHQVTVKSYDFGDFVTSINGITPASNQFWSMYINDQMSQVGASEYETKSSDIIRWQIDSVQ